MPGYRLYTTDAYKILPLGYIRLKTILFQAAYHDYSKVETLNTVLETVTLKYLVLILQVMENIQQDTRIHISGRNLARN